MKSVDIQSRWGGRLSPVDVSGESHLGLISGFTGLSSDVWDEDSWVPEFLVWVEAFKRVDKLKNDNMRRCV